jgi:uncharacterized membrane protein YtjA (UPF0391 family)
MSLATNIRVAQLADKVVNLVLSPILFHAIAFLELTDQLLALSTDRSQIVIGQLAPLFPQLSGILLPFPLDLIPIHCCLLV